MTKLSSRQVIQQTKQVYNTIASHFSSTRQMLWEDIRPLAQYAKSGDTILDLGCGNGRVYQMFRKKQGIKNTQDTQDIQDITYIGVDQSEELIKLAKEKFPEATFMVGEMTKLSFVKEQFDVIYCVAAFHHLPTQTTRLQALREMKRVLKKGGKIVMTNWNLYYVRNTKATKHAKKGKDFMIPWKDAQGNIVADRYYHGFSLEELSELARAVGLIVEKQYTTKNIITIFRRP